MLTSCSISLASDRGGDPIIINGYSDAISVCRQFESLMFFSVLLRGADAKTVSHAFNAYRYLVIRSNGPRIGFDKHVMDVQSYKGRDGFVHLVFSRKKALEGMSGVAAIYNTFSRSDFNIESVYTPDIIPQSVSDAIYEAIVDNTTIPVLKEWSEYIARESLRNHSMFYSSSFNMQEDVFNHYGFRTIIAYQIREHDIRSWITDGLKSGLISIDGCNSSSPELLKVTGIDSYQEAFGQTLANRAQEEFKPLFDPNTMKFSKKVDDFFEVATYYSKDFVPYRVQKEVIQSAVTSLDTQDNVIISGQTGSGKTTMAIGVVSSHARKANYSALVMVPSKTIPEWVETIHGLNPLADVRVVSDLKEFLEATKFIKSPLRLRPLWIVMSENTIKSSYEERPGVVWDNYRKCYVCPHCGRPIITTEKRTLNGGNAEASDLSSHRDFFSKNNNNAKCVRVINERGLVASGCGAHLWTVARRVKEEPESIIAKNGWVSEMNWVNVQGLGWIQRKNIASYKEELEMAQANIDEHAPRTWSSTLNKQLKAILDYEAHGSSSIYPRRYSIAHYIRKHMNHCFDYLICDEVHQLASDSKRGEAFGTVIGACWKTICLTGTLSNGYAKGLFHLLFRTQTKKMLERGYTHDDITKFNNDYGVVERKEIHTGTLFTDSRGRQSLNGIRKKKERKELPGISQVLVADFLINNLVAVKKEDIREDLCEYTETPVGVKMDDELATAYNSILERVSELVTTANGGVRNQTRRAVKHAVLTANMFLDQPFGLDTRRVDNGESIELSDKTIRNKETELIRIAKKHKDEGEKMLIYVEFSQSLNIASRLSELLRDNDVNAIVMPKMAPAKRQKWLTNLAKEGEVDAVIMNPAEVDVGVNLLDYTTIIFYETGTELTKIRQASQRSNRINQEHPVSVYFMYYENSVQEDILGAISQKLTASKSIEGDFSESALQSMTEDTDITMKIAKSIVNNEHIKVDTNNFSLTKDSEAGNSPKDGTEAAKDKILKLAEKRLQFSERPKLQFVQIPVDNCVSLIA